MSNPISFGHLVSQQYSVTPLSYPADPVLYRLIGTLITHLDPMAQSAVSLSFRELQITSLLNPKAVGILPYLPPENMGKTLYTKYSAAQKKVASLGPEIVTASIISSLMGADFDKHDRNLRSPVLRRACSLYPISKAGYSPASFQLIQLMLMYENLSRLGIAHCDPGSVIIEYIRVSLRKYLFSFPNMISVPLLNTPDTFADSFSRLPTFIQWYVFALLTYYGLRSSNHQTSEWSTVTQNIPIWFEPVINSQSSLVMNNVYSAEQYRRNPPVQWRLLTSLVRRLLDIDTLSINSLDDTLALEQATTILITVTYSQFDRLLDSLLAEHNLIYPSGVFSGYTPELLPNSLSTNRFLQLPTDDNSWSIYFSTAFSSFLSLTTPLPAFPVNIVSMLSDCGFSTSDINILTSDAELQRVTTKNLVSDLPKHSPFLDRSTTGSLLIEALEETFLASHISRARIIGAVNSLMHTALPINRTRAKLIDSYRAILMASDPYFEAFRQLARKQF